MKLIEILTAAVRFGTRFHGPYVSDNPAVLRQALVLQPVIGLFLGILAAIPVVLCCEYAGGLQGILLFTSVIYLFLLEWMTRFKGLHGLTRAAHAMQHYGIPPEERLSLLETEKNSIGDGVCTSFYVVAKAMVVYLLFTRLALFRSDVALALVLGLTPALSRAAMLFAFPSRDADFFPSENSLGQVKIGGTVKIVMILFWLIVSAVLLAAIKVGGQNIVSLVSFDMTKRHFQLFLQLMQLPDVKRMFFFHILRYFVLLLPAILCGVRYWNIEAEKKLLRKSGFLHDAVQETVELLLLIMFLILVDELSF